MLKKIIQNKKTEIARLKKQKLFVFKKQSGQNRFKKIFQKGEVALIAEIKRRSPSAGRIWPDLKEAQVARAYEKAGAVAISVLTDQKFFGAKKDDLKKVKEAVRIPVLKKDFIIDEAQIWQALAEGADAILLIAAVLTLQKLKKFLALAKKNGLDCLVEVHNLSELKKVLKTDAEIIGINNRNLKTGAVDLGTTLKLAPLIPRGKIIVSESGVKNSVQVGRLKKTGVSGILVGESILRSPNVRKKIKELLKG